ncbi:MAG: hypothetical protein M1840_006498 [Geoglossum simile]|nr:MAG: hypothetical protein M1840_006498 [Geoglossum simile]
MFVLLFALVLGTNFASVSASPSDSTQSVLQPDLRGFDVSRAQAGLNPRFWACAFEAGYEKVVIRAYQQACGSGGRVDPNFVPAYRAATGAGFTNIDAYMFPCVGDQPTGVPCKAPEDQVQELIDTINSNGMNIQRLWFDIEPTTGVCNAWQLGADANLQTARAWIDVLGTTARDWGIYANRGQWSGMFGNLGVDVASDLPLWAVQFDRVPGVSTVTRFFGGWTSAQAKQFWLDTSLPECGGSVDRDSFLS